MDIIFGALMLPGMMFLFPVAEWLQWHPGYVLAYGIWLYAVWLLCRRFLGPQLFQSWRGIISVGSVLFLVAAVTFLMSLTPVEFPGVTTEMGTMGLHQRAMWILLIAVVANGIPVGYWRAQAKDLQETREVARAVDNAREALETRRAEAETGEEIQVKAGYKTQHIPVSAIRFIEGRNNYACFHLDHRGRRVRAHPPLVHRPAVAHRETLFLGRKTHGDGRSSTGGACLQRRTEEQWLKTFMQPGPPPGGRWLLP